MSAPLVIDSFAGGGGASEGIVKLRVLDLFSGIGGFGLGLERTGGFETVAFCEIDPFCRRVLAKHWPKVPCHHDVETRDFVAGEADVIVGGFPCQDISFAGRGAGITGSRSGLYRHLVRAIRMVRPRFAVMENVAALLDRGLGTVLGDLAEDGYDAEWDCVGPDQIGASQHRERVWVLADANHEGRQGPIWAGQSHQARPEWQAACREPLRSTRGYWPPGPREVADIPRMADGPADRAHRLAALGNAVVPQIPEMIGNAILAIREAAPMPLFAAA
ncbi:DNA cytosine methyltransferase [Methylobacterium sp. sgz302541]|uniref:DNA cytosine methyltransferase n=1 Tax=unclassified Methylobacterium TaxID=2615210 RepID=UPI003D34E02E